MTDSAISASVNRDVCVGHGRCYMTAPEIFDCDDEGFALVIAEATTETEKNNLVRAVSNCPEHAITTSD